jgi:hypothetical protein
MANKNVAYICKKSKAICVPSYLNYSNPLLIRSNWWEMSSELSDSRISEANSSPKRQKIKTQINGKCNNISRADENK